MSSSYLDTATRCYNGKTRFRSVAANDLMTWVPDPATDFARAIEVGLPAAEVRAVQRPTARAEAEAL